MRWRIIRVHLEWVERDGFKRIDVHPVDWREWTWFQPYHLVLGQFTSGRLLHITVTLRVQPLSQNGLNDLAAIRNFFGHPEGHPRCHRWTTTIRIVRVSGFTATGGFVATRCHGGHLANVEACLLRLRTPHHGSQDLTIST